VDFVVAVVEELDGETVDIVEALVVGTDAVVTDVVVDVVLLIRVHDNAVPAHINIMRPHTSWTHFTTLGSEIK